MIKIAILGFGVVGSGTAGHEGGALLVRKTVQEINKMFTE